MVVLADPLASGEALKEGAVETTSGAIVDILDGGSMAELGIAQAPYEAAVVAGGDLGIDDETKPIGVWHIGGLGIVLQFDEGIGRGSEAERAQAVDGRMNEHNDLLISCRSCGCGCWRVRGRRLLGGRSGFVGGVLEDGGDRLVGTGVKQQRTGAGGVDTFLAVAPDRPENADGRAEALFRMRSRPG